MQRLEERIGGAREGRRFSLDFYRLPSFMVPIARRPMNNMNIPTYSKVQLGKILLAEDDNDMRRFLGKALQNAGFDVASFDNGLSAYHRLREEPFELLLTDIVMPEMDGIELARRATELDPDIKVMFITGFAAVALNPDNNAPPQAKILSKPFHLKDLVNEVQRLLNI
jgi:two-component system cell cycle response regulator CpdR